MKQRDQTENYPRDKTIRFVFHTIGPLVYVYVDYTLDMVDNQGMDMLRTDRPWVADW
jgi:hypothetical protein